MALVVKDRVRVATTTTGTSDFALGGAIFGYQSFSAIGDGNQTYYVCQDTDAGTWEVGIGTYSSTGPTLSRDTILDSSSGGSKVSFAVGTKNVFCAYPAERSVYLDVAGSYPVQSTFNTLAATTASLTNGTVIATPSNNTDIANKLYVDTIAGTGIHIHTPVLVETPTALTASYTQGGTTPTWTTITSNKELATSASHGLSINDVIVFGSTTNGLTAGYGYFVKSIPTATSITLALTYDGPEITSLTNGTGLSITSRANSGVGAKLTNSGAQAELAIDGVTSATTPPLQVGSRILVYNQTNAYENGVYTVTNMGSGSTNWELTRAATENTYSPKSTSSLGEGDFFFVQAGATGKGESYVMTTSGTIIFGTTNLTFTQFSEQTVYSAGTGLSLVNDVFSITNTGVAAATYGTASSVPVIAVNAQGQITSATNQSISITAGSVSGLAASATTDTTNAANISSGTLNSARLSGSYTGITGVGTLTVGTWNGSVIGATYGGTGINSYAVGDLIYANTTTSLAKLPDVVSGNVLLSGGVGTPPAWGQVGLTTHVTGTLPVANGGTGQSTYTDGQLLIGNSSGNTLSKATLTAGSNVTITNGNGSITISATGGGSATVGDVVISNTAPSTGTWLETNKYYSKATYPALATLLGDIPDGGSITPYSQAQLPVQQGITSGFNGLQDINQYIAYGAGVYVAVGSSGAISYSYDAVTWIPVPSFTDNNNFGFVKYLNGRFIAAAASFISTSLDGINWTTSYIGAGNQKSSAAYGNGTYVVIDNSGTIYYSSDAITWNVSYLGVTPTGVYKIVFTSGGATQQFLVAAEGSSLGVYRSSNGATWTRSLSAVAYSVLWTGSTAIATSSVGIYRSTDCGNTWTQQLATGAYFDVAYNAGTFVAVGGTTLDGRTAISTDDGVTWTATNNLSGSMASVVYDSVNAQWVAASYVWNRYFTSPTGVGGTWTTKCLPDGPLGLVVNNTNNKTFLIAYSGIYTLSGSTVTQILPGIASLIGNATPSTGTTIASIAYGNGVYVCAPGASGGAAGGLGTVLVSSDAQTWQGAVVSTVAIVQANDAIQRVYFADGYFIALTSSTSGNVYYSTTGLTWTKASVGSLSAQAFIFAASTYVFVGTSGLVYSGASLGALVSRSAGANTFNSVAYGLGLFVAVGNNTTVYTSPDGITWTNRVTGSVQLNKVVFDNSTFVVVGNTGTCYTSTNGTTWTSRTTGVSVALNDAAWNGTVWAIVGASTQILSTSDFVTFTNPTTATPLSGVNVTFLQVVWFASKFLAISSGGGIVYVTSTDGVNWVRAPLPCTQTTSYGFGVANSKYFIAQASSLASSNDGLIWTRSNLFKTVATTINRFYKFGSVYYACTDVGLFRSTDGITFSPISVIFNNAAAMAYSGTTYLVVSNGTIFGSTDGINFSIYYNFYTFIGSVNTTIYDVVYVNGNFVVSALPNSGTRIGYPLYTSSDGITWVGRLISPSIAASGGTSTPLAVSGSTLLYLSDYGMYKSTDGGVSGSLINTSPTGSALNTLIADNNICFMYVNGGGVFISTDATNFQLVLPNTASGNFGMYTDGRYILSLTGGGTNQAVANMKVFIDTDTGAALMSSLSAPFFTNFNNNSAAKKPWVTRGDVLLIPAAINRGRNTGIYEWNLYSYNKTTTFFVPPATGGAGQKAFICAIP